MGYQPFRKGRPGMLPEKKRDSEENKHEMDQLLHKVDRYAPPGAELMDRMPMYARRDMRKSGWVKFFDSTKGFGYICQDNVGSKD